MKLVLKATFAIAAIGYLLSSAAMAFQPPPDQNGVPNDTVAGGSRMEKKDYQPPTSGTGSGAPDRTQPSGTRMDDRGSGRNAGHGGQKSD
ncbi:MAG: hypothetical protein AAF327_21985 [Cyanobacteria bacterium P01_A01_bin.37]